MAVKYRNDSLYRSTGIVNGKYLDILGETLDINTFELRTYTITGNHENRPDLLAYELYGNPKLWWVFSFFNQDTLLDPIVDFTAGLTITVPTRFN
jgi:hypothetical protein